MESIKKTYILDENKRKVAVQMDIAEFEKIEQVLEDYALGQLINSNDQSEVLSVKEAEAYYHKLDKNKE